MDVLGGKPGILCLHGGGTSGAIFRVQTRKIRERLSHLFEFVFIDGPFETPPGFGILPLFEDCGPYLAWEGSADHHGGHVMPEITNRLLEDVMVERLKVTGQPFAGVMGFSQGCRLATGLLLRQQHLQQQQQSPGGKQEHERFLNFKFGVLLMGISPALVPDIQLDSSLKIIIPTVHIVGSRDPVREEGKSLMKQYFDISNARFAEVLVGHAPPTAKADVDCLVKEILDICI